MTIYSCVTGSRYTMTATLYLEETSQDENSGEIVREYVQNGTIPCFASGIAASGKDMPGTFEQFSGQGIYSSTDYVRINTPSPLPKNCKISKVTDVKGTMWTEDDGIPTIFDSNGSTPVVGAGGRIMEYVGMLVRAEVQDDSIL
jgi:hypothetical protein